MFKGLNDMCVLYQHPRKTTSLPAYKMSIKHKRQKDSCRKIRERKESIASPGWRAISRFWHRGHTLNRECMRKGEGGTGRRAIQWLCRCLWRTLSKHDRRLPKGEHEGTCWKIKDMYSESWHYQPSGSRWHLVLDKKWKVALKWAWSGPHNEDESFLFNQIEKIQSEDKWKNTCETVFLTM